ncbi:MAG: LamG domain-containing protein [Saprospiraceae bacterium]|nr:LamG domain-containing protein [Saprospiraceae bacterium]
MESSPVSGRLLVLVCFLSFGFAFTVKAQFCDNQALAFGGNGEDISVSLIGTPVDGTGDFTVEAWFLANPASGFQQLFTLSGGAPFSLFSLGLIPGGQLALYWQNTPGSGGTPLPVLIPTNPANLEGACHHIAISRQGSSVSIYLNGILLTTLTTTIGPYSFDQFQVGATNASIPGSQSWDGQVDEIRLWSTARTALEIDGTKDCVLSPLSGLEVYWTLDQGADPGNSNPGMTTANDFSGNLNHGTLTGFALNGSSSNWVCNTCPSKYELNITDKPTNPPTLLTTICSGDAVNFCISENFGPVNPISGASVVWESSDDNGQNWTPVIHPLFKGYCFGLPKGTLEIDSICAISTTGFIKRIYRAKITKTSISPSYTCTYTTLEHELQICCPVTGTITLTPVPVFVPPVNTLCEGTVTVNVSLSGPPFLANLPIQWCIDGVHHPGFDNMTSFTYTGPANAPGICFEAKIQNCACPPVVLNACLPVDPKPSCTNLHIDPVYSVIQKDPLGGPDDYLICPGQEETLAYSGNFQNCTPTWQFHFDQPVGDPWKDLGSSNLWQNTNTLPQYPPPITPYDWPANANCIYYQVECRPPNYPHSGCPSCYSNILKVCLQQNNLLQPVIAASPNPMCEGGTAQINSLNPDPSVTVEQWYCNGLSLGGPLPPLSSISTMNPACYVLSVTDGCYTTYSNPECLIVCDPVAIIKCPEDNPCACLGMVSTFDGTLSYSNCGAIVIYDWKVQDLPSGPIQHFFGPMLVYTVPAGGSNITLCITDSNGCIEISKTLEIKPCE